MKRIKLLQDKGLTILEVLVAMLIMSLSLLLLLNMAMVALDGNDWSNNTSIATQMMQEKLEQMRNVPNLNSYSSGNDTAYGVKRIWKVEDAGNHLRKVEVQVVWDDIRGKHKTNSLTAYIKTDSL